MRKFLLFLGGLVAAIILIANIAPMVLLAVCVWLLYLVFKQFMKSGNTAAKIAWVIVGLIIASIGISNSYAVIGIGAAFVLYLIMKNWKKESDYVPYTDMDQGPFRHFEDEWGEFIK